MTDVSGVGTPLNLTIEDETAVTWLPGGGLSIDADTLIASPGAGTKIIDAVQSTEAFTLEAWVTPANTTQAGPARIVTLSQNPSNRNFTLGQGSSTGDHYDVRFRTTSTSTNGIPSLATAAGTLTTELTHVVYTRQATGETEIYLDGVLTAQGTAPSSVSAWDSAYRFGLGNEFTHDRPWLGELHLVAVFDQALSAIEVLQNFLVGPPSANARPVADAGPDQTVPRNTFVTLDGSGSSDPDTDPLNFTWTITNQPAGSTATLTNPTSVNPTFTPDVLGDYTIQLIVNDGTDNSAPDTVTVSAVEPVITSFSPQEASAGDQITMTGTNLASLLGGTSQVILNAQGGGMIGATVTSADNSTVVFTIPTSADTGFVTLTVDGNGTTSTETLTIIPSTTFTLAVEPSKADVIQGQSVSYAVILDSTTNFTQLTTLNVVGLPAGVTHEFTPAQMTAGQTAVLTISAPAGQTLETTTISVSSSATVEGIDITETADATLTIQPVTTSFLGRTVVADTLQTPLAGVTVTMLGKDGNGTLTGCTGQTVSDAAGNFALTNLPVECVGPQLIRYDGSTVPSPPGTYAGVDLIYTIVADQVTISPVLIHLPRIDNAETVLVQQNHPTDQILTFQTIPNLNATVYAGTIFTLLDGSQPNPFPLTAIQVPIDRLPEEMQPNPDTVEAFIVAFQPANATASQPVAVSFPNLFDTPTGTTGITLSTLDPTQGIMVAYGTGTVSEDGLQIVPDLDPANPGKRFGLVHFDWHGPRDDPPPDDPSDDPDHPECGDPIDLSSGILVVRETDLEIRGGRGRIGIERNYRTLSTAQGPFGIGTNHNYGHRLAVVFPTIKVITLIMPQGSRFAFVKQANGTFTNTSNPSFRGAVMTLVGSEVDLRWKDGTVFHFVPGNFQLGSLLESITDRNGNQTTLVRNPVRPAQIKEVIDPVGRKLTLNYNGADRITSIIDPIGRAVQYTYNSQGTLETVIDPEGGMTRYDYDPQNRMTQIIDARGIVVAQNSYNANGRVIQQIQADGGVWTFDYTLSNPLVPLSPVLSTTVTDPRGNPTTFRFNPQGFVLSRTDELGQTTQFEKENGTNLEISRTDPLGRTTRFTFDNVGNRTSITDPEGNVTTFEYEPVFNLLQKSTDSLGNETTRTYDAQGNVLTSTNPLNETITITRNAFGQPATLIDGNGNATTFVYNNQGNRISSADPLGNISQSEYDSVSRLISQKDARGFSTEFIYDGLNRVTQITDARNGETLLTYNSNGSLLTISDSEGNQTIYTYDAMNRLETRTDASNRQELYEYDFNDNLTQFADRKNQVTTYTYDPLDRRVNVGYHDGSSTSFLYDPINRLLKIADSLSGVINFEYDRLSRLTQELTPQGTISYVYDAIGRRTTRIVNGDAPVTYDYDAASRLTRLTQATQVVDLNYDVGGRRTNLTYSNGTSTNYIYDEVSRLVNLVHQGPTGTIEDVTYTYDVVGNRVAVNRVSEVATTLPFPVQAAYDAANQQIQFNSAAPNLTYDENGNLQSQSNGSGLTAYTWDVRNRLVAINGPTVSASFIYDARGRRISKTINGVTTTYQYDNKDIVAEMSGGTVQARYLNNPLNVDERFFRQGGTLEFYHADELGSTLVLSNENGIIQSRYTYDPFGNTTMTGTSSNLFQYTGRENDGTGLYYYRARYYSPQLQRFLGEDPILVPFTPLSKGLCLKRNQTVWLFASQNTLSRADISQHVNPFLYLKNSPLEGRDPFGLDKKDKEKECEAAKDNCLNNVPPGQALSNDVSACMNTRLADFGSDETGKSMGRQLADIEFECGIAAKNQTERRMVENCTKQLGEDCF